MIGTLAFSRPCERGIVTNWPLEIDIWHRLLPQALCNTPGGRGTLDARSSTLCVTCAPFTPDHLTSCLDEIAFEEFNFGALQRVPATAAAGMLYHAESSAAAQAAKANAETRKTTESSLASCGEFAALVVDLGYSCTYVVPMVRGSAIQNAVRRLNIGGRLMTALLQETVSFRQYNMMDEVKEKYCL